MTRLSNRHLWKAELLFGDPTKLGAHDPGPRRTNAHPEQDISAAIIHELVLRKYMVMRINSRVMDYQRSGKKHLVFFYRFYVPGEGVHTSGVSDLLVFGPRGVSTWGAVEVKAERKNPSAAQSAFLKWALLYGAAFAGVARSSADALRIVEGREDG